MTQSVATQKTKVTVENKAFTSENQSITVGKNFSTEKLPEATMDPSLL